MMFAAVQLCPLGGIVRHEETQEVANVPIGDFPSMEDAIKQACANFQCTELHNGVISKGYGKSGYMVVTTQELEEI
ncbi:hypothetical protein L3V77_21030 [Vibrio sp. DW001]|uniref:hypothetical protein n=1 Tax=Vibrio sp. DW001 TaxID=2912315 RepID=UPI0023B0A101|nr:hypothetical protein [Vibrio sp. DW001]WED29893.1 hypothetical protein L3V77_21030 [Vibrio sp. DW001]